MTGTEYAHVLYPLPDQGQPCTAKDLARYWAARAHGWYAAMLVATDADMANGVTNVIHAYELAETWDSLVHGESADSTAAVVHENLFAPQCIGPAIFLLCSQWGIDTTRIKPYLDSVPGTRGDETP